MNYLLKLSSRLFHNLGLWTRLALTITLGFLFFFTIFSLLSMRMINESTRQILEERRVLTEMAANDIDALLANGFYELEKATTFARFDPGAKDLGEEIHMLAHAYGRIGTLSLGVQFLDRHGRIVLAEPYSQILAGANMSREPHIRKVIETGERTVSDPFKIAETGKFAVALTIPIKDSKGRLISMLSGLVDISSPAILRPIEQSRKLGATGHAEIVDAKGIIIASTEGNMVMRKGEHPGFYRRMMDEKKIGVENVPYETGEGETSVYHIMAFVPLTMAEWGLSLGGRDTETLAPVIALRNNFFFFGATMLGVILAATLLSMRHLIRPIKALTGAAQDISQEKLNVPIEISEGGEIGVLGKSLEEMRLKLKTSLDSLRSWNIELENRVQERTRELEKLHHELATLQAIREAERMKSEFISGISHEIRTPLGFIKGYVTTLLRPEVQHSSETQREFLQIIKEETEKLQILIENLLDTSRIQAGTFSIDKSDVNMAELTKKVMDRMQAMAEAHHLIMKFESSLPPVQGDPQRLEQVLQNLLDNAIKYSTQGGKISVSGIARDGKILISITDEGQGIPQEDIGRIFTPFYRASSDSSLRVGGVGLGLSICKAIVEAHAGRIWAESTPNKGSIFYFTLPLTDRIL